MSTSEQKISQYQKLNPAEKMQKIREYASTYLDRRKSGWKGFGEGGETEFDTFMEKEGEDRSRLQSFKSNDPGEVGMEPWEQC